MAVLERTNHTSLKTTAHLRHILVADATRR